MATFSKAATGAGTGTGSNSGGLGFVLLGVEANNTSGQPTNNCKSNSVCDPSKAQTRTNESGAPT